MAVHAHGIKKAGAPQLGAEQGHIQLQEPGLAVVSGRQVQLAAAADSAGGGRTGLPGPALCHGQEAVHEMQLRLLDGVNEGILSKGKGRPSGDSDGPVHARESRSWYQHLHSLQDGNVLRLDSSAPSRPELSLSSTGKGTPLAAIRSKRNAE